MNTCSIKLIANKESAEKLLCGEAYNRELLRIVIAAHLQRKGVISVHCDTTDYHKTLGERNGEQFRTSNEDDGLLEKIYAYPVGRTESALLAEMGADDVLFIVSNTTTQRKSAVFVVDVSEYDGEYYEQLTLLSLNLID